MAILDDQTRQQFTDELTRHSSPSLTYEEYEVAFVDSVLTLTEHLNTDARVAEIGRRHKELYSSTDTIVEQPYEIYWDCDVDEVDHANFDLAVEGKGLIGKRITMILNGGYHCHWSTTYNPLSSGASITLSIKCRQPWPEISWRKNKSHDTKDCRYCTKCKLHGHTDPYCKKKDGKNQLQQEGRRIQLE
ncbi:hypothetical protein BGX24_000100 [Mortierella sp. AD032]|nr:hypothetical protein BGX24_000100 [Mortierella sp. AD032]